MQTHITPQNRLASLGTVGLLLLAAVAGMVFLLPASPVHAASPAVTLWTESKGVFTAATSGTVGSSLVIQGSGFSPAKSITIITTVGTLTIQWLTQQSCATVNGGIGSKNSLITGTTSPPGLTGCLTTSASGGFQVTATIPALPGGSETIVVSDGTNSVSTAFTITSAESFGTPSGNSYGFPEEAIGTSTLSVTGFGAAESVSFATTAFTTASFGTPACTTNTVGSCSTGIGPLVVADVSGGSKTITATGATSGLTGQATYTVNPWVVFYDSATGQVTTFSFVGAAPTSILIEGHGFPSTTIAASSITVAGVATNHAPITPGASGSFYDQVVAPTSNVPYGLATVVIGGSSFSYALGNILASNNLGVSTTNYWGGALISSIAGTAISTGVVTMDATNYKPGTATSTSTTFSGPQQNTIGIFAYGFVPANVVSNPFTTPGATFSTPAAFQAGNGGTGGAFGAAKPDANGALFGVESLGDTPWSSASSPTTAQTYTQTVTEASGPANILSPSFGITPWYSEAASTVDYTTATLDAVTVHGFGATDGITTTIGGTSMVSGGTCAAPIAAGTCATSVGQVPDLASGKQTVVATGTVTGTSVSSSTVTYDPRVDSSAGGNALSINNGGAGSTTVVRTGPTYGVHGLAANTAFNIVWNAVSGGVTVGTFTSTATGGIPIPGVQVTIPSDTAGIHILDIQSAAGVTAIYGDTKVGDFLSTEAPFSSAYISQFGDLLFSNVALLTSSPSVATIGVPNAITGTGLAGSTQYVVSLCAPLVTCPGLVSGSVPALGTFTSTAAGAVPASVSMTLADTPSITETGTIEYFAMQTAAHYGCTPSCAPDAIAKFVLAASASLNATSAPAGHSVSLTSHALNAGGVYDIVFNYVQSPIVATSYTGTITGVVAPNAQGAGSANWNIPAGATPGSYTVQLVVATAGAGGLAVGSPVLDSALTITVGGTSGTCTNEGTSCMGIAGTPVVTKSGGNTLITVTYTNNSNAPQTAYIYGVVHNALGQTVYYTTATVTPASGASQAGQLVLFGLPSGTYSVSLFAVSTSGIALSTSSTVSVTV